MSRKIRATRSRQKKFALCLRNDGNPASLEVFKVYRVLARRAGDEPQDIRIVDESGDDYLYPRINFLPLNLPAKAIRPAIAKR
jgi:hypothetical protein